MAKPRLEQVYGKVGKPTLEQIQAFSGPVMQMPYPSPVLPTAPSKAGGPAPVLPVKEPAKSASFGQETQSWLDEFQDRQLESILRPKTPLKFTPVSVNPAPKTPAPGPLPPPKKAGAGEWLGKNTMAGLSGFNKGLAQTADFILPDVITPKPVQQVLDSYKKLGDDYGKIASEVNQRSGTETLGGFYQGTVSALPTAAMALMSGGISLGGQGLAQGAAKAGTLAGAVTNSVKALAKNPMFWTSFAQTAGGVYEKAKQEGAGEIQAQATALISGLLNAGVEVGGGPEAYNAAQRGVSQWVRSMLEEGREEVIQSAVENLTKKALYAPDTPYFSLTDEDAVVNPKRGALEFAGGAVAGGLLGGMQRAAGAAGKKYGDLKAGLGQSLDFEWAPGDLPAVPSKALRETDAILAAGGPPTVATDVLPWYHETGGGQHGGIDLGRGIEGTEPVGTGTGDVDVQRTKGNPTGDQRLFRQPVADPAIYARAGATTQELVDSTGAPEYFSAQLDRAIRENKFGLMVSAKTPQELADSGAVTFMSRDGLSGAAVTADGDIEAVFRIPGGEGKRLSYQMIVTAVENGGVKLDCYGADLVYNYSRMGFEPVARVAWDPEYAPEGWTYGPKDVYVMKLRDGLDAGQIQARLGLNESEGGFHVFTQAEMDALPVMEYDEALAYRDSLIEGSGKFDGRTEGLYKGRSAGTLEEFYNDGRGSGGTARTSGRQILRARLAEKGTFGERPGAVEEGADFARRVSSAGMESGIVGGTAYAYRPAPPESANRESAAVLQYFREHGISAKLIDGPLLRNADGFTVESPNAATGPDGTLYISNRLDLPAKEVGPHELLHHQLRKGEPAAKTFHDALTESYNTDSPAFERLFLRVSDGYLYGLDDSKIDLSVDNILEEMSAYFCGFMESKNGQMTEAYFRSLKNPEAVLDAYERMKRANTIGGGSGGGPSGFGGNTVGAAESAKKPGELLFPLEPGEHERGFSRNIRTDQSMPDEIRRSYGEEPLLYGQKSNKKTLEAAQRAAQVDFEASRSRLYEMLHSGIPSPEAVPLAKLLAKQEIENGNMQGARQILSDVAERLTTAGQFTQAAKILRESDAETLIAAIEKQFKRLNAEGRKRYRKKWKEIKLTERELADIAGLEPGDRAGYQALFERVQRRVADELPASLGEKFDAWRKTAMLLNPVTQVRNLASNLGMTAMDRFSSRLSGLMQGFLPADGRTRAALVKSEYKKLAKEVFSGNAKELLEQSSRFDRIGLNLPDKRVFRSILPRQVEINGHKIYNPLSLENIRKFTYWSLEAGDSPFFRAAYVDRLASYMQAKGIKDLNSIPKEGFDLALQAAREATFKDPSRVASAIAKMKGANVPVLSRALDTILPFSKTPVAIAKRGVEYSPLGLVQAVYHASTGAGAAKAIDSLAKGLTGAGMFTLGALLYHFGIITAGSPRDKDKREFEKSAGLSSYSVLGKFSYDSMQPFSIPVAAGASFWQALEEQGVDTGALMDELLASKDPESFLRNVDTNEAINAAAEAFKAGGNVLLDQPMLQGVGDFIGRSGRSDVMGGLAGLPLEYAEQMVPSGMRRIAGFVDPVVRATRDSGGLSDFYAYARAAIPWKSKALPEKRDVWGRVQTRVEDPKLRFVQQFISPSNLNIQEPTEIDRELLRLYGETKSNTVFPAYRNKPFRFKSGAQTEYEVGYRELPRYQKAYGEAAEKLVGELIENDAYRSGDMEAQQGYLEDAYTYAQYLARREIAGDSYVPASVEQWAKKAFEAARQDIPIDEFIVQRAYYNSLDPIRGRDGETLESAADQYRERLLEEDGLTAEQKRLLDRDFTGAKRPADYASEEAFILSRLTEPQQERYEKYVDGKLSAKEYAEILRAVGGQITDPKTGKKRAKNKQEKKEAIRELGYETPAYIYKLVTR